MSFKFKTPILFGHWDCTIDRGGATIPDQSGNGRGLVLDLTTLTQSQVWDEAGVARFSIADKAYIDTTISNNLVLDNITSRVLIMAMEMQDSIAGVDGDHGTAWDISESSGPFTGVSFSNNGIMWMYISDGATSANRESTNPKGGQNGSIQKISGYVDIANTYARHCSKSIQDFILYGEVTLVKTTTLPAQGNKFAPMGGHPTGVGVPDDNKFKSFTVWIADQVPANIDTSLQWMVDNPGNPDVPW